MGDDIGLLSAEMLDLCSSFESSAEFEVSFKKTPDVSEDILKNIKNTSLNNLLGLQENGISNTSSFQWESGFNNTTGTFECLSLDHRQMPSICKVRAFKQVMLEANEAYSLWMTSQLMLDCCKSSELQVRPELATRIRKVIATHKLKQLTQIKSRSGGVYNLFGLEDGDIEAETNKLLSTTDRTELRNHAVTLFTTKIQLMGTQRRKLKGVLGSHGLAVAAPDSVMCEERARVAALHQLVRQQLQQAGQLLVDSNTTMVRLARLVHRAETELRDVQFASLRDRARHLHTTTSLYKHRLDQEMSKHRNDSEAVNALGDNLKASLHSASERLKSLEKALAEYQRKEESSKRFKEIISEYRKTKRHLQHKYQTLNVLNDPDISFS